MSGGLVDTLVVMLAVVGVPILMIGLVWLVALQLRAEHDPDSLLVEGSNVPMKMAVAGGILAAIGGFLMGLASVAEFSLGLLFVALTFWLGALRLLGVRKPR